MTLPEILNLFLMEHSYFYTRLREKVLLMRKEDLNAYYARERDYIRGEQYVTPLEAGTDEEKRRSLASFVRRYYEAIEDIILTAKASGVDVILAIPPYPFFEWERLGRKKNMEYHKYYDAAFERARRCLEELGKKHDLLVIDADRAFLKAGRKAEMFIDDIHLTKKGNYALADIMASEMLKRLRHRLKE